MAYFAKCPDCAEPVRVPAAAEVEDDWKREKSAGEGETYRLSLPTNWDAPDEPNLEADSPQHQKQSAPDEEQRKSRESPKPLPEPHNEKTEKKETGQSAANTATCPACGASFEAALSDQPQVVLCPECLEDVHVPPAPLAPSPSEPAIEEEEEILKVPEPDPKPASNEIPWDSYMLGAEESEAELPKKSRKKRRKKSDEQASPEKNPRRGHRPEKHINDVMAEVRQVEEDPPPEWTFFSGVTDFLLRPAVLVRWLFASMGLCLMGWLVAFGVYVFGLLPIAVLIVALPLIFLTIMTLSYTAANSLPILVETASGKDEIEGWPEPSMKEQAVDLIYVCFIVIVAEAISFFLGQLVGLFIGPAWLLSMIFGYLLFPIILLSSLEANSPYVPFTIPILKSLKTVTWAWGMFYGMSFGLMLIWVLPLVWIFGRGGGVQFFGMMVVAPLVAGWCFIASRLLGRLAWRASLEFEEEEEDEEKPKRKKPKKKRDISESSGELQAAR